MSTAPKYRVLIDEDRLWFINPWSGGEYGYVDAGQKPFIVCYPDGEVVGRVNSLRDALPLILDRREQKYLRRREFQLGLAKKAAYEPLPFAERPEG